MDNFHGECNGFDHEDEEEEKLEDLKLLLNQARFQISILEDQLKVALGEIKFLREELSCSELELITSRSQVKVLLEELATYKAENESKEDFPDLLLSSLDKLYSDKQQQLWLIAGIHNNIERKDATMPAVSGSSSVCDRFRKDRCDTLESEAEAVAELAAHSENAKSVPNHQAMNGVPKSCLNKKQPALTLDLTKAYDFTPSAAKSLRSFHTPSSIFAPKHQSWTPTAPTPCSALRPSLSLHNLASKTFTEVLVPSIQPPGKHQVTPPSSASPKSPRVSPSISLRKMPDAQQKIGTVVRKDLPSEKEMKGIGRRSSEKTKLSPPKCDAGTGKTKMSTNMKPTPGKGLNLRPYTSLSSLSEISEKLTFLECKKEISV